MMQMQKARLGVGVLAALGIASVLAVHGPSTTLAQTPSHAAARASSTAGGAHAAHAAPVASGRLAPAGETSPACKRWTKPTGESAMLRRNGGALTGFLLAAMREGVTVMQARAQTDPTSWIYQANIHGTTDPGDLPAWSSCQHGTYHFLAWHRMYLYFFERILRKASGFPTLALPYWNYSDPRYRVIPKPYIYPANATNSLYIPQRDPGINAGNPLPAEGTDYTTAFSYINFSAPNANPVVRPRVNYSFGGLNSAPDHAGYPPGQFESLPHNAIHNLVGGTQGGYMAIVEMAARDPIFWAHHSNIDRLWGKWLALGGGRANPPADDKVWNDTEFTFFDENGACVLMTGADIGDAQTQLGYTYEDDGTSTPVSRTTRAVTQTNGQATDGQGRERVLAEAAAEGVQLTGARQTVAVAIKAEEKEAVMAMAKPGAATPSQLSVVLEGIEYDPGAYYTVYLNLPASVTRPTPSSPYYVGVLAPFAMKAHAGDSAGVTLGFDITRVVSTLTAQKLWKGDAISLTFVPGGVRPPGASATAGVTTGKLRVTRLQVVSEP
jgi:tyrosinase